MAQNRYISTSFWKDSYIAELDPSEKYLFLYLLTNQQTNIAGIYEIGLREIAFDSGYDDLMVKKILARFERDRKIIYRGGWVVLFNWQKHQQKNPKVVKGIERIESEIPDWLKELIEQVKLGQTSLLNEYEV